MRVSPAKRRQKPMGRLWPLLSLVLAARSCDSARFGLKGDLALPSTAFAGKDPLLLDLRGGDDSSVAPSSSKKKSNKKKNSKSKKKSSSGSVKTKKKATTKDDDDASSSGDGKGAINQAMEQDPAQALGDAIRSRADELRTNNPLLDRIDLSVYSVGLALGASDRPPQLQQLMTTTEEREDDDGGVAGSPSSVVASYFLKSHGGAHALQCVCSLLASSAGFASLMLPANSPLRRVLLKRTMLFAMTKHVAGLLGAALIAGRAIPDVGLRKARVWMEQLAADPVSQYVFYAACVLLWLPSNPTTPLFVSGDNSKSLSWIPSVLVLPILLREVVSTMLVISDVLVLWSASIQSSSDEEDDSGHEAIENLLQVSQKGINVVMSLLVTPSTWRSADPAERQRILAKLTSKVSLLLEVIVGLILTVDAMARMMQLVFGTTATSAKPALVSVIKRLICARIYLHFLWSRKRKINKLVVNIRGGSSQLPFYVLDVLLDPMAAMGLQQEKEAKNRPEVMAAEQQQYTAKSSSKGSKKKKKKKKSRQKKKSGVLKDLDWKDYVSIVLGLDED
ncbi:expressed unknown protein [Seminavis robusta]|uniref:Uncharacterized protein n=1 Tax=Seminavis robusta TaxID=568900 RepID=A0A9N8HWZ5_9STRA|nr:expressed unknown protein [Seminavis robusta]|eukprot:Sro2854_g338700.1 n/a (563) ;mRNA; r:3680-5460